MGYNVDITNADASIAADKLDGCFEALKALNKRDDLKTGGSYGQRPDGTYDQIEAWFAWMPANYDETCQSAEAIFNELGFETYIEDGALYLQAYSDKSGAQDVFLEAAAPFITAGSYIEWDGEDGERWRQDFDGESMTTRTGRTVWE